MSAVSLCAALGAPNVTVTLQEQQRGAPDESVIQEDTDGRDPILSGPNCHYKRHSDNLALGALDFTYVPSQMMAPAIKQTPTVGDLCVRLALLTARSDEYASIVDLYNTYCVKGSIQMATTCLNSYLGGAGELYVPAIPIHVFVSEWNRSLKQFHELIRCTEKYSNSNPIPADGQRADLDRVGYTEHSLRQLRSSVMTTVMTLTFGNVPALSEHLWFILHCVVSKPSLVREAIQLVGAVASFTGSAYHTGEVDDIKVPGKGVSCPARLYLIAKSAALASMNDATALGDEAGASLGLVWVNSEEELFDHLRNV